MHIKRKHLLATGLTLALLSGALFPSWGQQKDSMIKSTKDAEILIPRPFRQPVQSLINDGTVVLDSIETQTPGVKILLMANNTWKYYKDPSVILRNPIFTENWNEDYPDPYHTSQDDLPEKISIWVVDTLSAYCCPDQVKVYSPFGTRHRRCHNGVDLPLRTGDPVFAAFSGKVRFSKYYHGYGNLVIIRHENGLETFYAHLSKRDVEAGQWVEAGQRIGLGGSTGRSTGAHLHFETRFHGYAFDPQWLIDFESGTLRHRLFVLKKQYLTEASKYIPDSDDDEIFINTQDAKDYAVADSIAKVRAEEQRQAEEEAAKSVYVTVRAGDTLSGIAKKNGISLAHILKLNPHLSMKSILRVGQTIRVK